MVEIKLWLYYALLALGINILSRTHLIRMKQVEPTLSQYEMLQYWKRWPFFISPLYTSSFLSRWFFCHMHLAAFLSIHVSCWKRSDPLNICIGLSFFVSGYSQCLHRVSNFSDFVFLWWMHTLYKHKPHSIVFIRLKCTPAFFCLFVSSEIDLNFFIWFTHLWPQQNISECNN